MPSGDVDLVLRYFELLSEGDIDAALALADEGLVVDLSRSEAPWRGVSRGREGARRAYGAFRDAWDVAESVTWAVPEATAVGRNMVAAASHVSARGRASGIEIDAHGGWLAILREGRIVESVLHQSFDETLLDARRRAVSAARLYFVCDGQPNGRDPAPLLHAALRGGADLIQLRDKDLDDRALINAAKTYRDAADEHGALFMVNDRPDLVPACGADGVHVGQDDAPLAEARRVAGQAALVGLSTHSCDQVSSAVAATGDDRPDQISVGPVWETPTKEGRPGTGLELIEHAAQVVSEMPWFAIGGIDTSNVGEVVSAGAERIVVVRAIRDADDPEAAARELRAALE